ncbi:hypothetical protein CK203_036570 [Vitis vinifera]|uniref:Uncharacterized protein n=1 Tax=Vitis vinifera TaxID=29760 RepID=A0A438HZS2_VITVI|nr:hypothetical protein CK203_036570 [Vitis vinifera]
MEKTQNSGVVVTARGRVQIASPEDELDNLQQLLDIQPAATTTPSSFDPSDPSDSSNPSVVGSSSSKKRTRGLTRNLDLLSMKPGEKKTTLLNTRGQVVYDGKWERLSNYMGTLVRSQHNVPIQVQDWNHVSEDVKEKIWALVLMRRDCAIDLHTYRMMIGGDSSHFWGTPEAKDQFQQLLSQPEGTSSSTCASSGASTSVSSTSVASTYVDEIYTQVMGPERHGRVRGYGFGPTPTSIFGSTSRRRSGVILSTQLENAQEMLI